MTTRRISWTDLERLFGYDKLDLDELITINGEVFRVCGADAQGFLLAPVADEEPCDLDHDSEADG